MPWFTQDDGVRLHFDDTRGAGPPVLFSHGLLWSGEMFRPQVEALRARYRCITYDHRGQGRSDVPPGRSIPIERCTTDAIALIEGLGLGPCHVVGLSMGGFVGMRLAARRPELVRSLTLLETSADPEPAENVPRYRRLNLVARWLGVWPVARQVLPIMLGRTSLTDPAREADREAWLAQLRSNPRSIHKAVTGVIEREGIHAELGRIVAPTLVAVGDEDVATVPAKAERIHAAIAGSVLERIPRAGHTSSLENPGHVSALLTRFLDGVEARRAAPGVQT